MTNSDPSAGDRDVVVVSAARTPIGSYGRSLKGVPPTELGTIAAKAALSRAEIDPEQIEHVVFGNVIHTATEDMYMARVVGMRAGIPQEVPAFTVNRLCGTGVQAIVSATQMIAAGEADVVLAGGAESMSRGPYWIPSARWGARMGNTELLDPVLGGLTDPFHRILMGGTAENLADRMGVSRAEQDAFAVESRRRACAAQSAGLFDEEVEPVPIAGRKGELHFARDEHLRADASEKSLSKLPPVFREDGGTVTAGNSSGMNDAGAALVLMAAARAREIGVEPLARIAGYASCGVDPRVMGIGPVPAVRRVLSKTGATLSDIGVIELNEAFAAQALAVIADLELDPETVNPNGGAIALGHPIAASGAVIASKALGEMRRCDHELGLVTLCIGGGQGIALLLERLA